MDKGIAYKMFTYFLCFSFLLLMGGFPKMDATAKEKSLSIGGMISRGEVKFEASKNVWKKVEPSHFPIFQGIRIKTEKGLALIALANESQIEVGQESLFSLQHDDQFHLFQGGVFFRIPSHAETSFRVGNLSIGRSLPLEATKGPLMSPKSEESIGSIVLHPNGAVTVKSIRGPLSIQNQDHVVLAALSATESVTIPSITASEEQRPMVAQVGEYPTGEALTEELLGLSKTTWMFIAAGVVAVVGGGIVLGLTEDDEESIVPVPICPP